MIVIAIGAFLTVIAAAVSITLQALYWNDKLLFASSKTYPILTGIGFISMMLAGNLTARLFQYLASIN